MENHKDVLIRQVRPEDLDAVTRVEALCFPSAEAATRDSFFNRISVFSESFLVAEIEGIIVGFINGSVTKERTIKDEMFEDARLHDPEGFYQSVFGLDVAPEYQHKGLAGQLMRALIGQAKSCGRKGVILTCKEGLIGFYEGFGYQCLGRSHSIHGGAVWYDMILEF